MFGKKAQTQSMSIIIITGIIISLVSVSYMWGKPLIEKRSTVAEFTSIQNFILEIDDKITDIANSGSGKYTLELPFGTMRAIAYNPSDLSNSNMLIFEHDVLQPIVLNATIPIKTNNIEDVATYGEAKPRKISMTVNGQGEKYSMEMKLHYRELDTNTVPRKGFLIEIIPTANFARRSITISFAGTELVAGAAANKGDLVKTKINVELV
jgi:hypothetical protein